MLKKMWKWSVFIAKLIYALFVLFLIIMLSIAIFSKLRTETNTMNTITLVLGAFSIPGIIISFKSIFELNEKKVYKVTTNCPKCKHLVDLKMEEY